jgi:tRNA-specific 2-thiouridylase
MSGGVDSSVVAYLLSQQFASQKLVGIHMSNWDFQEEGDYSSNCWEQDWKDVQQVAQHLQIHQLHHVSFQKEYWNDVFAPYCHQVSQSITPNPDVDCNRYIKFGILKQYLQDRYQIHTLATGHYARLWDRSQPNHGDTAAMPLYLEKALEEESDNALVEYLMEPSTRHVPILLAARDSSKDQSYFLSGVPAQNFANVLFPLGDYYKSQTKVTNDMEIVNDHDKPSTQMTVRELAQQAMLPNASKRDSMGICFVGKRKHGEFLNEYIAPASTTSNAKRGAQLSLSWECVNIEDQSVIAKVDPLKHSSLMYATAGQGAKLSGASQKWFVVEKQINDKNQTPRLLLCPGTHHPALYSNTLYIKEDKFHWMMNGVAPPLPFQAKCRIRHLQPLVSCEINVNAEGQYIVQLKTPLHGIAPGQVRAVYASGKDSDLICLGGGPIDQRGPTYWDLQIELPSILHPAGHNDLSAMSTD